MFAGCNLAKNGDCRLLSAGRAISGQVLRQVIIAIALAANVLELESGDGCYILRIREEIKAVITKDASRICHHAER
jgi:hypothetical protein